MYNVMLSLSLLVSLYEYTLRICVFIFAYIIYTYLLGQGWSRPRVYYMKQNINTIHNLFRCLHDMFMCHANIAKHIHIHTGIIYITTSVDLRSKYNRYIRGFCGTFLAGTVPDLPNTNIILSNIGHRVGHQSGLDASSGQKISTRLHGIPFRIYFMFSKIGKVHILTNTYSHGSCTKRHIFFQEEGACGKPATPSVGLGDTSKQQKVTYINKYVTHSN